MSLYVHRRRAGNILYDASEHGDRWWRCAVFGPDGMVSDEAMMASPLWAMRWVEDKAGTWRR
jgi:hypothetical protein